MANENMNYEEVIETTEEITTAGPSKGLKIAGGIGLLALMGVVAYKGGKWIAKKVKAKKEQQCDDADVEYLEGNVEASDETK